ncbi:2609_t:CDS:2 [Entrophospora sp. SA101]|nr:2609_t:CDS:2 [Entrophospora sp. SA101]
MSFGDRDQNSNVDKNHNSKLDQNSCPYIQRLNKQKKEKHDHEKSNLTKQIFNSLFPGGPLVNSLLGTFYISSVPNFILYFVPPDIDTSSLNSLVSFAVGGLLGDVFLHLIPHSFLGEDNDDQVHFVKVDEQKNIIIGLAIFIGFVAFFIIDKSMRVLNGGDDNSESPDEKISSSTTAFDNNNQDEISLRQRNVNKLEKVANDNNSNDDIVVKNKSTSIKLSAYLNLIADATHNFTDGLAMAASFYTSPSIGATTTVAVFFHEIPHEIGDYAILIQSGFTKKRAMFSQFITAIGAFLGTLTGIIIEEYSKQQQEHHQSNNLDYDNNSFGIFGTGVLIGDLVIPFTAGGFLYIATVGVIPELLNVSGNFTKDLKQSLKEFSTMFIGVMMMAIISWNEV